MSRHVVIIGNGISGVTAARFIRKLSDYDITMISDETDYFYSRTALMYIYMGHMRYEDTKPYEDWFWEKNDIRTLRDYVEEIDTRARTLRMRGGGTVDFDILIIATGSKSNRFGWPGQDLEGVQGLYGMPDLQQMEAATGSVERAVVVGGGLIGIEMAEMLHARHIPVTFLVREEGYMDYVMPAEESALIGEEIRRHGIDLRLGTELKEIRGDGEGRAAAVVTKDGEEIACQFVGLTAGVHPNVDVVRDTGIETNRGVLVDEYFATNVEGIFAIGDCAEFQEEGIGNKRIEQLWYTGRMHGKTVAQTVCGTPSRYDPGPFFNSAKFFTIEWQTYGTIHPERGVGERPAGVETVVWQAGRRLVRIDYDADAVLGFNVMGVRFRHEVCERWLREERPIEYVLAHLHEANFDPEFQRRIGSRARPKSLLSRMFG